MKIALGQINPTVGDFAGNAAKIIDFSHRAQAAGAGIDQFGLSDMTTVQVAIGKGADEVAVMDVYANYPGGFYWLKSSGIKSVKDLAGKKVGNPPGDAARAVVCFDARHAGALLALLYWLALQIAGRAYVLETGRVALSGDAHRLLASEEMRRAYLGSAVRVEAAG